MVLDIEKISNEHNLPLRVSYAIKYIYDNNIDIETVKKDFMYIRKIERAYNNLFKKYVKEKKIILSKTTNFYSINGYKKRGETGTIIAIKYLINMMKYEYNIDIWDLQEYKYLTNKYFNSGVSNLWFEYNRYNIYSYSSYYKLWQYERPLKNYIYYTDKKYYKIIKNLIL